MPSKSSPCNYGEGALCIVYLRQNGSPANQVGLVEIAAEDEMDEEDMIMGWENALAGKRPGADETASPEETAASLEETHVAAMVRPTTGTTVTNADSWNLEHAWVVAQEPASVGGAREGEGGQAANKANVERNEQDHLTGACAPELEPCRKQE